MRKLNGMDIISNEDPDEYLAEVFQQRDELKHIGANAEASILNLILEGPSGEYEPIMFTAERDSKISLK